MGLKGKSYGNGVGLRRTRRRNQNKPSKQTSEAKTYDNVLNEIEMYEYTTFN